MGAGWHTIYSMLGPRGRGLWLGRRRGGGGPADKASMSGAGRCSSPCCCLLGSMSSVISSAGRGYVYVDVPLPRRSTWSGGREGVYTTPAAVVGISLSLLTHDYVPDASQPFERVWMSFDAGVAVLFAAIVELQQDMVTMSSHPAFALPGTNFVQLLTTCILTHEPAYLDKKLCVIKWGLPAGPGTDNNKKSIRSSRVPQDRDLYLAPGERVARLL